MAQGYKDFVAASILTAADLEDYNQNQSTMRFASAAARDAALTTVKTEGMRAYLIDSNTETIYTGSAWSTIGPVHGVWITYAPLVTQSGAVSHTDNYAKYMRIGRMIHGTVYLTCTGPGTASNGVSVSLPVTAASANSMIIGSGRIYDSSATTYYPGLVALALTTAFVLVPAATNDAGTSLGALNFTAALASPDEIHASFCYEAAADA